MPMDLAYIELELDAVEKRGGGRLPQEMAKSNHSDGALCPYPKGIPPELMRYKRRKTERAVGAQTTQVLRR